MEATRNLLFRKTSSTYVQFFRYGFVATVSLAVDFGLLIVFVELANMNHLVAASLSFIFGLITNYMLSVYWVFHSSKLDNKKNEFVFFAAIGIVGLAMTDVLLWLLTNKIGIFYMISKAIAVVIVYFWNFGVRKYYLFN